MRAQRPGQEPGGYVKIFVVRLSEVLAPGTRFVERGRGLGNAVVGRQRSPAAGKEVIGRGLGGSGGHWAMGFVDIISPATVGTQFSFVAVERIVVPSVFQPINEAVRNSHMHNAASSSPRYMMFITR